MSWLVFVDAAEVCCMATEGFGLAELFLWGAAVCEEM